jgi:hypothetical protein
MNRPLPGAGRLGRHRSTAAHAADADTTSASAVVASPLRSSSRRGRRRRNLTAAFSGVLALGLVAQLHVFSTAGEGTASAAVAIQPLVAGKTLSGVIAKGGLPAVNAFGNWRGRAVDVVTSYTATDTWAGITNVAGEALTGYLSGSSVHRVWSVPMLPLNESASLSTEANGGYNDKFATVAKALIAGGDGSSTIRLGWEMTGDWYPWSGAKNPTAFVGAWRQIVNTMRAQSGAHFTFDFNIAMFNSDPTPMYPGDAYVDLVGADNYDDSFAWQYPATDHTQVWNYIQTGPFGLNWLGNFAKSHGKRLSFPEWGVSSRCDGHSGGDDPYFMQQFHNWMASHDVAYETYSEFAENSCRNFSLTSGAFPNSAALYQKLEKAGPIYYGGGSTPPTTTPPTTKPPTTTPPTTKPPTTTPPPTKPPTTTPLAASSVWVSVANNRSGGWVLNGSQLRGYVYIFVNAPANTAKVQFWLDNPTSANPTRTEGSAPFDFSGTNGSVELPWNASSTWAGTHTLIVHATLTSGAVQSTTITFITH